MVKVTTKYRQKKKKKAKSPKFVWNFFLCADISHIVMGDFAYGHIAGSLQSYSLYQDRGGYDQNLSNSFKGLSCIFLLFSFVCE